jgi:hypothetical protein
LILSFEGSFAEVLDKDRSFEKLINPQRPEEDVASSIIFERSYTRIMGIKRDFPICFIL